MIPTDCVSASDYERYFHERMPRQTHAYISGAAGDGTTQGANLEALHRRRLIPRLLPNMQEASAMQTLFGQAHPYPILIAPMAYQRLVHQGGEVETILGADLASTTMIASCQASVPMHEIAQASNRAPWFQLYFQAEFDDTLELLRRAENSGFCAIVVTLDAPINGIRNQEQRAGFQLPPHISAVNLQGLRPYPQLCATSGSPIFSSLRHILPSWDDFERLCKVAKVPVLAKGILHEEDAEKAIQCGASGIIVSNHGGRVLDSVIASADALPPIARQVNLRVPILLDGGIRRGTDIVKAIALGADAVLIGQPILHALAIGGMASVAHLLTILQTEFEAAMLLCGCAKLSDIRKNISFDSDT